MNAVLQEPGGTSFQSYSQHYSSTQSMGADGRPLDLAFKTDVYAEALRVVHTWDGKLGPFSLASVVSLPTTHIDIKAGQRRDSSTGLGDPAISPLYLGYSTADAKLHIILGMDLYAPIGKYSKNRLANNGSNYWTFAPIVHMTWLPNPRWEISSTVMTSFNIENPSTDYRSGNSISVEGVVGYHLSEDLPALKVAMQGWGSVQYTDDKADGHTVLGNRARAYALGPQVAYSIGKRGGGVVLKWQKEFGVENRSEGDIFWFQFAIPL